MHRRPRRRRRRLEDTRPALDQHGLQLGDSALQRLVGFNLGIAVELNVGAFPLCQCGLELRNATTRLLELGLEPRQPGGDLFAVRGHDAGGPLALDLSHAMPVTQPVPVRRDRREDGDDGHREQSHGACGLSAASHGPRESCTLLHLSPPGKGRRGRLIHQRCLRRSALVHTSTAGGGHLNFRRGPLNFRCPRRVAGADPGKHPRGPHHEAVHLHLHLRHALVEAVALCQGVDNGNLHGWLAPGRRRRPGPGLRNRQCRLGAHGGADEACGILAAREAQQGPNRALAPADGRRDAEGSDREGQGDDRTTLHVLVHRDILEDELRPSLGEGALAGHHLGVQVW
mmetsp:Transcript_106180/g.342960  ORF Transcript_106180/g.342960 Transcript_106180/m.342960 type:complete len:342 (+) Transcript_106180:1259-2284(+)